MSNQAIIYNLPVNNETKKNSKKKLILDDLLSLNKKKTIKLRARKGKTGAYSLYLDIWFDGARKYDYLKLYVFNKPNEIKRDQETLKLALEIRDKKELELYQSKHDFELKSKRVDLDFVNFFLKQTEAQKKKGSKKPYQSTYNYLKSFTNGSIPFSQVDKKFCLDFKEYLLKNVGPNTAHTYFSRLKAMLNKAVAREIIVKNPSQFIQIKKEEVEKEFLTAEEIKKLIDTPSPNEQTKRAFLFSCFTGLRFSDIQKLTFDEIRNGFLHFRQTKTGDMQRIPLSENALEIINQQIETGIKKDKVFRLHIHDATRKQINKWIEKAELKKHVTWHTGRHTFACLALEYDIDIYTVRDLLGHKDLKNTQIYVKLIDKKKEKAISKLPKI